MKIQTILNEAEDLKVFEMVIRMTFTMSKSVDDGEWNIRKSDWVNNDPLNIDPNNIEELLRDENFRFVKEYGMYFAVANVDEDISVRDTWHNDWDDEDRPRHVKPTVTAYHDFMAETSALLITQRRSPGRKAFQAAEQFALDHVKRQISDLAWEYEYEDDY